MSLLLTSQVMALALALAIIWYAIMLLLTLRTLEGGFSASLRWLMAGHIAGAVLLILFDASVQFQWLTTEQYAVLRRVPTRFSYLASLIMAMRCLTHLRRPSP